LYTFASICDRKKRCKPLLVPALLNHCTAHCTATDQQDKDFQVQTYRLFCIAHGTLTLWLIYINWRSINTVHTVRSSQVASSHVWYLKADLKTHTVFMHALHASNAVSRKEHRTCNRLYIRVRVLSAMADDYSELATVVKLHSFELCQSSAEPLQCKMYSRLLQFNRTLVKMQGLYVDLCIPPWIHKCLRLRWNLNWKALLNSVSSNNARLQCPSRSQKSCQPLFVPVPAMSLQYMLQCNK
jgi:hypothetical protein